LILSAVREHGLAIFTRRFASLAFCPVSEARLTWLRRAQRPRRALTARMPPLPPLSFISKRETGASGTLSKVLTSRRLTTSVLPRRWMPTSPRSFASRLGRVRILAPVFGSTRMPCTK
jgi:hypothetical protein